MWVDTHCHLFMEAFDPDRAGVLENARRAGIGLFLNVGIDEPTSRAAADLAAKANDVYATVGLHPHSAHLAGEETFSHLAALLGNSPKAVAVGECGLDYLKSEAPPEVQKKVFLQMAGLALEAGRPLIVHCRNAFDDALSILARVRRGRPLRAVIHCFSEGPGVLRRVLDEGYYVSFTGNVTFPSAGAVRESARLVPEDRFFLETDSPYLAPQPVRGRRNEPAHIKLHGEEIARLRGVDTSDVERQTTENALRFFGIVSPDAAGK